MSVSTLYSVGLLIIKPDAIPATGAFIGTPASIRARVPPHTEAIEVEPLDAIDSETILIVYGNCSCDGITGRRAFSASAPCPIILLFVPPIFPVSPVENGGEVQ